jgi:hypothetical protein
MGTVRTISEGNETIDADGTADRTLRATTPRPTPGPAI